MDLKPLLVTLLCLFASAERDCVGEGLGQCTLLSKCDSLMSILKTPGHDKSIYEILRNNHCGFEDSNPKICCPTSDINIFTELIKRTDCTTPAGNVGTCTKLEDCDHMNEQIQTNGFISTENMEIIRKSKCNPPGTIKPSYVCCKSTVDSRLSSSPSPIPEDRIREKCPQTSFPPKPDSECCGIESSSDSRIVGGMEAQIDQFPWLAMIEYSREGYSCGGSLISGRYVLTAAHCLVGPEGKGRGMTSVRLGEYNKTNPGIDCSETAGGGLDCTEGDISVPIESYVVHEGYVAEQVFQYHDIALIRLKEIVNYTDFIRPICLPTYDFSISASEDMRLFIAGWGISDETQQHSSDIKLFAKVPYVKKEQCNERYLKLGTQPLLDSQLCVGGEAKRDSCKGDSGGPLMSVNKTIYEAAGVISFGTKSCGLRNWPSIYTKVYDYLDWISKNIKP